MTQSFLSQVKTQSDCRSENKSVDFNKIKYIQYYTLTNISFIKNAIKQLILNKNYSISKRCIRFLFDLACIVL